MSDWREQKQTNTVQKQSELKASEKCFFQSQYLDFTRTEIAFQNDAISDDRDKSPAFLATDTRYKSKLVQGILG